jgi:hypothetical protein
MASGGTMYIPRFIKIGSVVQNLLGGVKHREQGDLIWQFSFFQNKKSKLKEMEGLT